MIEDGLVALITADTRFSAIAEDRLFPVILPETLLDPTSATPTSATYQVISAIPDYTFDGPTGMVTARVQIDTWASAYGAAKALAQAIKLILDDYTGTLPDGTHVDSARRDNVATDGFDQDARLYRVQTDFKLIYSE